MSLEYPKLQHNYNCMDRRCKKCLEDSQKLEDFLEERIDQGNIDYLGHYRYWLDNVKKFDKPETDFGWFNFRIFEPKLLDEFINYKLNIEKPWKRINNF